MNTRLSIAALAATFLVALGGCQLASTVGDTETTPVQSGGVAFRLSPQNVTVLQAQSLHLQYKVSGVGMDTLSGSVEIDTAPVFIPDVPTGVRFVELTAVNPWGVATWYGRDSVVVNAGAYAYAHITLRRLGQGPTGTVVLDVSLDSIPLGDLDSVRIPVDTIWSTRTYHTFYPTSHTTCGKVEWAGHGDSLRVRCTRVIGLPIATDTTWADTTVDYPVSDTARWCRLVDTSATPGGGMHASFHCLRLRYQPYAGLIDTVWRDSANASFCYPLSTRRTVCYRPSSDCAWAVPVRQKTKR